MTTDWLRTLRRGPARTARRSSRRRRPSPALAAVAERLEGRVLLSCANNQAPVHPYVTGLGLDPIPANMPGGQRVADLEASDPDGDRVTFRLAPGAPSSDDGYFSVDAETGEIWLERAFGPVGPWSDDGAYLYSITVEAVDECEAASPINVNMSVVRDGWSVREADADPGDGGFTDDPWCPDCTQPGYFSEGNPHPILHFDVDVPYDPPAYFEATLTVWDGATAVTVADARRFDVAAGMAGATGRIAFQFDASAFETGFHSYTLELTAKSSAGATVATRTLDGRVAVANRADGEYGNRWWLPFLDRLDVDEAAATAGGVGLIRGDGTAEFFAGAGGTYASPIGTFETLVRTTDANEATTGYRLESPDGWTKHFDAAGLLTAVTDRNGWAQTFTYTDADSDGLTDELATFTDFAGFTASYTYANGRLSSSSNGRGATYTYSYNADGTLASTSGPPAVAGGPTATVSYTYYTGTKLLHTKTDVKGLVTTVTYGSDLRVRSIDRPGTGLETITPSQIAGLAALVPIDDVVSETTIGGEAWSRVIDSLGNVAQEIDPNGNVTEYVRNVNGLVREIRTTNPDDPTGPKLVTQYDYNARGRVTRVTHADGTWRQYGYAANGLDLLSETDERGQTWTYTVDAAGNRLTATDPLGNVTSYAYDARGNLETVTEPDPDGAGPLAAPVTEYEYDAHDRVTQVTNPDLTVRTYTYDPVTGNVATETDERGHTTGYTYDAYGRVKAVTLPDPDGAGPLTSPVWTYVWCACGSLKSVTDPLGHVTAYEYDEVTGLLESTTSPDPDGSGPLAALVTSYTYDAFGRVLTETAPGNRVTTYGYDGNGNLTSVTLPDPDGAGSQVAPVWEYGYDALNRRVWAEDPLDERTTYSYDALGRLATETDPTGYVTEYLYTADGRPLTVKGPKKSTSGLTPPETGFTYDDAGRLTSVTDPLGHVTTYAYDDAGRLASVTGPPPGDAPGVPTVVVGRGDGAGDLRVLDARTGAERFAFDPDPNASGPARVALGDQTGDGVADVVVSPANSSINNSAVVKIYDGVTGALVRQFIPWANYTAGAFLADSDVAEGEANEIVVASAGDLPGTPHGMVRVFRSDGTLVAQFIPIADYDGVLRLATADVDGDGKAEILVCRADTVSPPVRVFSITYDVSTGAYVATHRHDFIAFPGGAKGAFLAGGDVDGDGRTRC